MQVLQIDLRKNPEISDFVKDKEPGDKLCLYGTIKSLDDQTMVVTLEEVDEDREEADEDKSPDESVPGNEGSGDVSAANDADANDVADENAVT
jgi:hypothetical protein